MSVRDVVYEQVRAVAEQQGKRLPPLGDDMQLMESGLDSLCIAILVANLDDVMKADPFGSGDNVDIPVTLGDLVRIYQAAPHGT